MLVAKDAQETKVLQLEALTHCCSVCRKALPFLCWDRRPGSLPGGGQEVRHSRFARECLAESRALRSQSYCGNLLFSSALRLGRAYSGTEKRGNRAGHKKIDSTCLYRIYRVIAYAGCGGATTGKADTGVTDFVAHRAETVTAAEEFFLWRAERLAGIRTFRPGQTSGRRG